MVRKRHSVQICCEKAILHKSWFYLGKTIDFQGWAALKSTIFAIFLSISAISARNCTFQADSQPSCVRSPPEQGRKAPSRPGRAAQGRAQGPSWSTSGRGRPAAPKHPAHTLYRCQKHGSPRNDKDPPRIPTGSPLGSSGSPLGSRASPDESSSLCIRQTS